MRDTSTSEMNMVRYKNKKAYLNSFIQRVRDKNGRLHSTRITWVDELPGDFYSEDDSSENGYHGYRNMVFVDYIKRINEYMAEEIESYNAGAAGIRHYRSELYVKKSFWKKFHLPVEEVGGLRFRFYYKSDKTMVKKSENIRGFKSIEEATRYQKESLFGDQWYLKME